MGWLDKSKNKSRRTTHDARRTDHEIDFTVLRVYDRTRCVVSVTDFGLLHLLAYMTEQALLFLSLIFGSSQSAVGGKR